MKTIPLTQGQIVVVDDEDFEWLSQWKWCTNKDKKTYYAHRGQWDPITKKVVHILMHRLIMDYPKVLQVDHINGNGLDNRRENLRLVTRVQQCQNRSLRADNKSGYKGVYWFKETSKWRALIKVNGKRISLGLFDDVHEAGRTYEAAAKEYFGEYRRVA